MLHPRPCFPGYSQLGKSGVSGGKLERKSRWNSLKIDCVELVLGGHVDDGFHKCGPVLRVSYSGREETGSGPATDGDARFNALNQVE